MKNFKVMLLFTPLLIVLFYSGCGSLVPNVDYDELEPQKPTARITEYDQILYQFGKMYRAFYKGNAKVYIQSKPIENATASGELPYDISQMVISAVNKIGKPVYYVPYDPKYITMEMNTGGALTRNLPKLVIAGAITEYDKNIIASGSGTTAQKSGMYDKKEFIATAGGESQNTVSRLAIDLHLLDYNIQTMIPGTQAINTIEVKNLANSNSFSFYIFGSGLGLNGSVSRQQGIHATLRILVETTVLQLLAREAGLPYWKITGGEEDPLVINKIVDDLSPLDEQQLTKFIQIYLVNYGFKIKPSGKMDDLTNASLSLLSKDIGFKYDTITPELAKDIWLNQPYLPTDKRYTNAMLYSTSEKTELQADVSQGVTIFSLDYDTAIKYIVDRLRNKVGKEKYEFVSMIDTKTQSRTAATASIKSDILDRLNTEHQNIEQFFDSNSRSLVRKKREPAGKKNVINAFLTEEPDRVALEFILTKNKVAVDRFTIKYERKEAHRLTTEKGNEILTLTKTAGIDSEMKNDIVTLTTHKGNADPLFYSGESINFEVSVTKPLYVHLMNIDSDNKVHQLFSSKSKLVPGKKYTIPGEDDNWEIVVQPPYGREAVKIFASEKYIDFDLIVSQKDKNSKTRSLVKQMRTTADKQKINFYEKGFIFETAE
ncbi:MAG: DUF4384 domain-containing protein [Sulfurimonadaceae bacterium]